MCFEHLTSLKCKHYESTYFEMCPTKLGRDCKKFTQKITRREKGRSCIACKAKGTTFMGVASPSLRKL
jgi:hypothetical protein